MTAPVDVAAVLDALDAARAGEDAARRQLPRPGGSYRCCPHCADDAIHDVPTDGHDLPCTLCLRNYRPAASGGATDGEREDACVLCGYPRAEHEGDGEMVHDFRPAPVASQADGEAADELVRETEALGLYDPAPVASQADDRLRDALRIHHPIMRSETGPFSGCRCGAVGLGQDVIAHVVAELRRALDGDQ